MSSPLPECPPSLKSIKHFLKIASEYDERDPVVAYWCRLHALQRGMKLGKPEAKTFLFALMDLLEKSKTKFKEQEAISNEVVAQAYLENCALRLFKYGDDEDHKQNYGKNIVKAFYTAGMLYEVLTQFGPLSEEAAQNEKYSKWKAAYIHNCLKCGETPVPGPVQSDDNSDNPTLIDNSPGSASAQPQNPASTSQPTPPASPSLPSGSGHELLDPNDAITAASRLPPVPYTPDPNPGGFVPYEPSQTNLPQPTKYGDNTCVASLTPDQVTKAQKYCKWAASALMYDDFKTAIDNLRNALELLQTGKDPA